MEKSSQIDPTFKALKRLLRPKVSIFSLPDGDDAPPPRSVVPSRKSLAEFAAAVKIAKAGLIRQKAAIDRIDRALDQIEREIVLLSDVLGGDR